MEQHLCQSKQRGENKENSGGSKKEGGKTRAAEQKKTLLTTSSWQNNKNAKSAACSLHKCPMRWSMLLQDFNIEIHSMKGTQAEDDLFREEIFHPFWGGDMTIFVTPCLTGLVFPCFPHFLFVFPVGSGQ